MTEAEFDEEVRKGTVVFFVRHRDGEIRQGTVQAILTIRKEDGVRVVQINDEHWNLFMRPDDVEMSYAALLDKSALKEQRAS